MGVLAMRMVGLGLLLRVAPAVQGQITVMQANCIVVLDKGRIVEKGTHAELLKKEGLYYHLYMAQFSHALEVHDSAKSILDGEDDERPNSEYENVRVLQAQATERQALATW